MYTKIITEEIIRLQANGFTAEETRTYLKDNYQINIGLNTVYRHRHSPIGHEMLMELIRHQERSILKADSTNPALAMKYRADLISKIADKVMPDLIYSKHKEDVTINSHNVEELNVSMRNYESAVQRVLRRYIREDNTP